MRLWLLPIIALAIFTSASPASHAEGQRNVWEFFDYGEELGWSMENDAGKGLSIHRCLRDRASAAAAFRATSYLSDLPGGASGGYFITVRSGDREDNVFVTPHEYFGTEFMFELQLPNDLTTFSLELCASAESGVPPDPECQTFKGADFDKLVADLCN